MSEPRDRITPPATVGIPGFSYGGVNFLVPVDLPSGGFLQVVVGDNPLTPATPSIIIPKGCMLALIPADVAAHLRPGLNQADAHMRNPHIVLPSRS